MGTYTVVASFAGTSDYSAVQSAPVTFSISPTPATVLLTSSSGSAVYGQPISLVAKVDGRVMPTGTVTFLDDGTAVGTVALDGSGSATLTTSTLPAGSHLITATYSGNTDFSSSQSGPATESVSQAGTTVVLTPQPVLKKKKVVSETLTAKIEPAYPAASFPMGTVTFELVTKKRKTTRTKTLGTATVRGKAL